MYERYPKYCNQCHIIGHGAKECHRVRPTAPPSFVDQRAHLPQGRAPASRQHTPLHVPSSQQNSNPSAATPPPPLSSSAGHHPIYTNSVVAHIQTQQSAALLQQVPAATVRSTSSAPSLPTSSPPSAVASPAGHEPLQPAAIPMQRSAIPSTSLTPQNPQPSSNHAPTPCTLCLAPGHTAGDCPAGHREAISKQADLNASSFHGCTPAVRQHASKKSLPTTEHQHASSPTNHISSTSEQAPPPPQPSSAAAAASPADLELIQQIPVQHSVIPSTSFTSHNPQPSPIHEPTPCTLCLVPGHTTRDCPSGHREAISKQADAHPSSLHGCMPPDRQNASKKSLPTSAHVSAPNSTAEKVGQPWISLVTSSPSPTAYNPSTSVNQISNMNANQLFWYAVNHQIALNEQARLKATTADSSITTVPHYPPSSDDSGSKSSRESDSQPNSPFTTTQGAHIHDDSLQHIPYASEGEAPMTEPTYFLGHNTDEELWQKPRKSKRNKRHPDQPLKVQLRARKAHQSQPRR